MWHLTYTLTRQSNVASTVPLTGYRTRNFPLMTILATKLKSFRHLQTAILRTNEQISYRSSNA